MTDSVLLFLFSVFIASFSQILLKKSAGIRYKNMIKEYLNIFVFSGYVLLFLSAILTTYAYRMVPLKFGPIIESTGYIYILFLSFFFLKEKITRRKLIGNVVIAIGILVFSL